MASSLAFDRCASCARAFATMLPPEQPRFDLMESRPPGMKDLAEANSNRLRTLLTFTGLVADLLPNSELLEANAIER